MTTGSDLRPLFEEAQALGFLGPGPVAGQVDHAVAFSDAVEAAGAGPSDFLDLGSGGGIPGLVLAARWHEVRATLLDSSQRRTAFLRTAISRLGWEARIDVVEGRAEALARLPELRATFRLVVSRSFGPPAVTAEIGGAFLESGGALAVSEPVETSELRWPPEHLAELGLGPAEIRVGEGARSAVIRRTADVGDRWPRAVGVPSKRPLW